MTKGKIPAREEIPQEYTWNLKDIYESDEKWSEEFAALESAPAELEKYRGRLGESAGTLLSFMRLDDELSLRLEKLIGYASCKADQDLGNGFYQDMRGKAMRRCVELSEASAFARPEIMAIPEETLNSFYAACPELEEYRRSLYRIRRRAEHILSPSEEKLLSAAGEMADSPDSIGGALRNADLRFEDAVDSKGEKHPLSSGTLVPLMESSDRTLRKSAFENCFNRYGEFKNTVASILDAQFKQLNFFARARKYPSTLSAALDATEVPEEVYMNLISAVHDNMEAMYRYVRLRKRALGVDELHMYDVYTPIVSDAAEEISYEQAKETVLSALGVLGEDYVELLKRASMSVG